MTGKSHTYSARITWSNATGTGKTSYKAYSRDHVIGAPGKPDIAASSDAAFRGDAGRYNPEDLLVASISSCHMLWYLHLAAVAGVVVTGYVDEAEGTMVEDAKTGGRFTAVVLRPRVTITSGSDPEKARAAHEGAHKLCFIANSVNFPVTCEPSTVMG
jgi:organic hydroperoxide reductase OsmC/OhrA